MKLTILGGGGVRMPAFVRAVLTSRAGAFDEIRLFEPDPLRRDTTGRLAVEIAEVLGRPGVVRLTADAQQALTGTDFVFSAIRVGGDRGRMIDEDVALSRGLVGQETTGPGGCAMALRTIPVVLSYCELLSRCAPGAILINFTNPAGLITQAISAQGLVQAVGVCDTPGGTVERLFSFLGAGADEPGAGPDGGADEPGAGPDGGADEPGAGPDGGADEPGAGPDGEADRGGGRADTAFSYGGLNHLGWVCSLRTAGQERMGELLDRYPELQRFDHRFEAFDPAMIRRVGAVPTEYVYYFYDAQRYLDGVAKAGTSRGQDVLRLNEELLADVAKAFADGDVHDAWSAYSGVMGIRRDTYMRTDMQGDSGQEAARARRAAQVTEGIAQARVGGYEGLALRVIDGLTGRSPGEVIVNTRNGGSLDFIDPGDVVEVPARVDGDGLAPRAVPDLPRSAKGLVLQVKEYERAVVEAAMTGRADLAAVALALHPLVPGISAARQLMAEYIERHGEHLAYLT
jgi:6-phospho-beta-glucosidase